MVTGDWDRATASFEEAVAVARRNGARRHEAKSLAFAAAAGNARGDAATALRVAVAAGRLARSLRALPVVWPAALVAADAATALSDDGAAAQHRGVAADVLRVVVDTLPADLRAAALRRPPAAALLA